MNRWRVKMTKTYLKPSIGKINFHQSRSQTIAIWWGICEGVPKVGMWVFDSSVSSKNNQSSYGDTMQFSSSLSGMKKVVNLQYERCHFDNSYGIGKAERPPGTQDRYWITWVVILKSRRYEVCTNWWQWWWKRQRPIHERSKSTFPLRLQLTDIWQGLGEPNVYQIHKR